MMVTGGNVTGIADQLAAEGPVVRLDNPKDRRAYNGRLTADGRKRFMKMAAAREKWVVDMLGVFGEKERDQLYFSLAKLKPQVLSMPVNGNSPSNSASN